MNLNLCCLCIGFSHFLKGLQWWFDFVFPHIIGTCIAIAICIIALRAIVFISRFDIIHFWRRCFKSKNLEKGKNEITIMYETI